MQDGGILFCDIDNANNPEFFIVDLCILFKSSIVYPVHYVSDGCVVFFLLLLTFLFSAMLVYGTARVSFCSPVNQVLLKISYFRYYKLEYLKSAF